MIGTLARKSMKHRLLSVSLTFVTLLISCVLLISVAKLQTSVRSSFERTISGVDLIVGPETGSVNLLLYALFRMGDPLASIDYQLHKTLQADPAVAWSLPLSMGDSHRGYRVLGTSADYFKHYEMGEGEKLAFSAGDGESFHSRWDTVVIGSKVAQELGYGLGKRITISHGVGDVSFEEHTQMLFEITGILKPTGTAVDRSLHVSLEGLEAVHAGWSNIEAATGKSTEEVVHDMGSMEAKQTSVLLVSLKSKLSIFEVQRKIQDIPGYQAILPGVAFQQFWQIIEVCEAILQLIALLVFLCTLTGMVCAMIAALAERRREMAILRALGGSPGYIATLLWGESLILTVAAAVAGWVVSVLGLWGMGTVLSAEWGIYMEYNALYAVEWSLAAVMVVLGLIAGFVPAALAYRQSWNVSLSPRV